MRRTAPVESAPPRPRKRSDWGTIAQLLPYLWEYKWRVIFAIACLVLAKVANMGVPLVLKEIIDELTPLLQSNALLAAASMPMVLLVAYGLLRLSTTVFTELREFLFARVTQNAVRAIAIQVFDYLHALSLRFHLNRQTGGVTRDIERGSRAISSLVSYTLYSILPTLIDCAGGGLFVHQLRHLVLGHHCSGTDLVHFLHRKNHGMAPAFSPHHE